jgi:predicted glycogen debranching enzyme
MPSGSAFVLGPHVCGSTAGFAYEWLVADGVGGYAMGTASGLRTRRYHALLAVPGVEPGVDAARSVGLVALDPTITLPSGATVRLAVHEWESGAVDPCGHHHLERFDLIDGLPRWRWRIGDVVLDRELAMVAGRTAVGVVHRLIAGPSVRLSLTALCTWRDADGERHEVGARPHVTLTTDGAIIERAYRIAGPGWRPNGEWYRGAYAREEARRGLPPTEDLWCAGFFGADLTPGAALEVSAWAGDLDRPPPPASAVVAAAHRRARKVIRAAKPADAAGATLALAADAFIVRPASRGARGAPEIDVLAGYPWSGPRLRDTMTAYDGLFLHTGRAEEGRALLLEHGARLLEGLDRPRGDADGPLWFVHAVDRHVAATGDRDLAAELLPVVEALLTKYQVSSCDGVGADQADGLLTIEADTVGLTWMNARHPGGPVTPRDGKPVELNALWANALGAAVALRQAIGGEASDTGDLVSARDAVRAHFGKRYGAPTGWLFDVVDARPAAYPLGGDGEHDDPVLRPNQLLAFSLPYAPLDGGDGRAIEAAGAALLTPLGLRTLAPHEFGYHGRHRGDRDERAAAYHQGTVWPWLIGPYVSAVRAAGLPVTGNLSSLFAGLEAHLGEAGLGSVSETADGDPPHHPAGAPFSARSVAELIRARSLAREVGSHGT